MKSDVDTIPGPVSSALALVLENLHLVVHDEIELYVLRMRLALSTAVLFVVPLATGAIGALFGVVGLALALHLWLPLWAVFLLLSAAFILLTLTLVRVLRRRSHGFHEGLSDV